MVDTHKSLPQIMKGADLLQRQIVKDFLPKEDVKLLLIQGPLILQIAERMQNLEAITQKGSGKKPYLSRV